VETEGLEDIHFTWLYNSDFETIISAASAARSFLFQWLKLHPDLGLKREHIGAPLVHSKDTLRRIRTNSATMTEKGMLDDNLKDRRFQRSAAHWASKWLAHIWTRLHEHVSQYGLYICGGDGSDEALPNEHYHEQNNLDLHFRLFPLERQYSDPWEAIRPRQLTVGWYARWHPTSNDKTTEEQWRQTPAFDHPIDAMRHSGYLILQDQLDEWRKSLPAGTPLADLEFFQIFNKPLPPVQPLEEFMPWAAKEDLLPWSPL
jgi:hypothetical protein